MGLGARAGSPRQLSATAPRLRRFPYGRLEDFCRQRARVGRPVEQGCGGVARLLLQAVRLEGRGSADPQAGGYALAKIGGKDVAGIGPVQDPKAPSAWM